MSGGPSGGVAARVFDLVPGLDWPDGDERQLRAAAMAWHEMGKAIGGVAAAAAAARTAVTTSNTGDEIDTFARFGSRIDGVFLPDTAQACRLMAQALEQYAEQVAEAKHRIIVECTIAGAAIIAGIGLFVIPVVGQFAAASAAATAAALIAFTGAAVGTLAATACTMAATVLVGAALGAVSAVAINLVVAQPIRMAFGDQQWLDWNAGEAVQWAKGGAIGGAFSGGVIGAAQLGSTLSPALAASTPRLAAALKKLPAAVTSTPGRMTVGSLGNAATSQLLNGRVTGLDLLLGAVGGLGGTTARPSAGRIDAVRGRLIMDERGSVSFGRSGEPPDTPLVNMRAPVDDQGRLPVPLGWEAQVGIQQHRGVPHGGDMAVSALTNGGRNLEVVLVDFKGHGAEVAPDALPWAEKMQRTLLESPGDDFMPAANALAMDFWEGGPPAWHANIDLHTGAFDLRIAGGDPALIYHADTGEVTLAAPEIAPMLGAIPGMDWPPLQGQLQPGDALILYTDGMIEHRRIDKDIGIELLGQEAARVLARDYWDNTGRILDWLPDYGDDRALVVIRRPPAPQPLREAMAETVSAQRVA